MNECIFLGFGKSQIILISHCAQEHKETIQQICVYLWPATVSGARDTIVMTDMALVFIGFTSPEVLSLATLDILDWMILCCGMLSSVLASIH